MTTEPAFKRLAALDCSKHVEKKGKFSYLSWPWAVRMLREADPAATWEVRRFDGLPYLTTECGVFVEVAVTVEGVTLSQIHPVLNGQNRPIPKPNAFDINTSIQRCLVKAIALHGLGLYVYAGEDLPGAEDAPNASSAEADKIINAPPSHPSSLMPEALASMDIEEQHRIQDAAVIVTDAYNDGGPSAAYAAYHHLNYDQEQKLALGALLSSKVRSGLKAARANADLATQP